MVENHGSTNYTLAFYRLFICFVFISLLLGCGSDSTDSPSKEADIPLTSESDADIPTREIAHAADGSVMVLIPAGEFVMGKDGALPELGECNPPAIQKRRRCSPTQFAQCRRFGRPRIC